MLHSIIYFVDFLNLRWIVIPRRIPGNSVCSQACGQQGDRQARFQTGRLVSLLITTLKEAEIDEKLEQIRNNLK